MLEGGRKVPGRVSMDASHDVQGQEGGQKGVNKCPSEELFF